MSFNKDSPNGTDLQQLTSQSVDTISQWASNRRRGFYILLLIIIVILWLASGIYIVQPGEEGVVTTFGEFTNVTTSGLHYHLPRPIQRVNIVDVESIRRAEIGFRSSGDDRGTCSAKH